MKKGLIIGGCIIGVILIAAVIYTIGALKKDVGILGNARPSDQNKYLGPPATNPDLTDSFA